jgi:hypothetical protein
MKIHASNSLPLLLGAGLAACGLLASAPSQAAFGPGPAEVEARFKAADHDGDGRLTREEAEQGMPRIARKFDELDTGKQGYLTLEQVKAAAAR